MSLEIFCLLLAILTLLVQGFSLNRLRHENARLRDREILDKVLIYNQEQGRDER